MRLVTQSCQLAASALVVGCMDQSSSMPMKSMDRADGDVARHHADHAGDRHHHRAGDESPDGCVREGQANGPDRQDIAVVDAGGNLKAFVRQDGAWLGSIDIAIKKAKTARDFDMPTGEIGKLSQPGKPLYQIEVSNGGLITFPGGIPLRSSDGKIIGAIGSSGSTVENDAAVAQAGVDAMPK